MKKVFTPFVNESTPLVKYGGECQVDENEILSQKSSHTRGKIGLKVLIAVLVLSLTIFVSLRYSSSMNHSIVATSGNNEFSIN